MVLSLESDSSHPHERSNHTVLLQACKDMNLELPRRFFLKISEIFAILVFEKTSKQTYLILTGVFWSAALTYSNGFRKSWPGHSGKFEYFCHALLKIQVMGKRMSNSIDKNYHYPQSII